MESTAPPLKTRYIIHTTVLGILPHTERRYISGFGGAAEFEPVLTGYFLHLKGSREAINLGMEKPEGLELGDKVKITIEKEM